jgi:hypothetical protein
MDYFKLVNLQDLELTTTMPVARAIEIVRSLRNAGLSSSRRHIDKQTLLEIIFDNPGRLDLELMLTQEERESDDIAFTAADELLNLLIWLQQNQRADIAVACFINAFPVKGIPAFTEGAAYMRGPEEGYFHLPAGKPTPLTASRSDRLTRPFAENLYVVWKSYIKTLADLWAKASLPSMDPTQFYEIQWMERIIFLFQLRGHLIREKTPWLGYDCLPLISGEINTTELLYLCADYILRAFGYFYRYPLMLRKFKEVLKPELLRLAEERRRGAVPQDKKIRILDIGSSTFEEPLTIILSAAQVLRQLSLPGTVREWIEVIAVEKEMGQREDLREFLTHPRWPKAFLEEFPPEALVEFRAQGYLVEGEADFTFSPEIFAPVSLRFIDLLQTPSRQNALFSSRYDFVFYIKVGEYLFTNPRSVEEGENAQYFINLIDSGQLLMEKGYFFTDSDEVRNHWTELLHTSTVRSLALSYLRRMPGMETQFGAPRTRSMNINDLLASREMTLPISALPLHPRAFRPIVFNSSGEDIGIYQFTGYAVSREEREREAMQKELNGRKMELQRGEKVVRKMRNQLAQVSPRDPRYLRLLGHLRQAEAELRKGKEELRRFEGGEDDAG